MGTEKRNQRKEYVTSDQFDTFVNNHFEHLKTKVDTVKSDVFFLKGSLALIVPLLFAILGVVFTILRSI